MYEVSNKGVVGGFFWKKLINVAPRLLEPLEYVEMKFWKPKSRASSIITPNLNITILANESVHVLKIEFGYVEKNLDVSNCHMNTPIVEV